MNGVGLSAATDLVDYFVNKDMAFRDVHEVVGKIVAYGISEGKGLSDMILEELKVLSDVFGVLTLEGSISSRNHLGGTVLEQVKTAMKNARLVLINEAESNKDGSLCSPIPIGFQIATRRQESEAP